MVKRLSMIAIAGAAILGSEAQAAATWQDSPALYAAGACADNGGIYAQVGFLTEPGVFPKTGDQSWIHIVAQTTSGCSGFASLEIRLPDGVVKDPNVAVQCWRGAVGTSGQAFSAFPSTESQCFQTPNANPQHGTVQYAISKVSPGQYVEVQIPVYIAKAQSNASLSALVNTSFAPLQPIIQINAPYEARFSSYSAANAYHSPTFGNPNNQQLTMSFRLDHFHVGAQVFVDYGTTQGLGSTTAAVMTDPQWTYYPTFTMPPIMYLPAGTTYYWRPRIVTSFGTFVGATQTATTFYEIQIPKPGPIFCHPRYGC